MTAIVVSYADPDACARALRSVLAQSTPPSELLVVDNDPLGATARTLAAGELSTHVRTLHPGANIGYTRAANRAAGEARGEWLLFLNPDAVAAEDCVQRLLEAVDGADVAIVGAQVLLPDGRVNAGANPINIAGVSWSGNYGAPRERGPARDTASVSGAALLVRRDAFLAIGGMCPFFFMYYDDADLAWRMRMSGRRVRYCPEAVVVHEYEFEKGPHKWFYLERNRLWALIGNLQVRTIVLLAPLLTVVELTVAIRAIADGWFSEKLRSWASLLRQVRRLVRWRCSVQAVRAVSDWRVLELFCGGVATDLIETGVPRWANRGVERYRLLLLRALALGERSARH